MIAPNIILPLDDTHANIPAGWTRVTELDGKYPKSTADGVDPGATGGSATHSHTGTVSHTHTLNSHTHTGTSGARTGGSNSNRASNDSQLAKENHTHAYTTGASSGGTTGATTANYGSVSNDPPYYTVIFIKQDSYATIPKNALVLKEGTTRVGMDFHTASANRYLKGANTGANAGGTGGSTTNVHDLSHTHTTNTHTHANSTSGGSQQNQSNIKSYNSTKSLASHTHTVTTTAGTQAIGVFSGSLTTLETVEPAYRKLNAFKANSDTAPEPGDIALWLGSLDTIPTGWIICDGENDTPDMRDRFLKINATPATTSTGGNNTHSHASQAHTHPTGAGHTHTNSFGESTGTIDPGNPGGSNSPVIQNTHAHANSTSSSVAVAYASANTSANSSNNEPEYRTVAYIQFLFMESSASPILNIMVDQDSFRLK